MFKNKDININFDNLDINKLDQYHKPIILDFGGTFCQPCKKYEKVLEEIKENYNDNVLIKIFDVSKDTEIAFKYDVAVIPHQVFINKNGEIEDTHTGLLSYEDTIKILEKCGLNN